MLIRILIVSELAYEYGIRKGDTYRVEWHSYDNEKQHPGERDMYRVTAPNGRSLTIYARECEEGYAEGITVIA